MVIHDRLLYTENWTNSENWLPKQQIAVLNIHGIVLCHAMWYYFHTGNKDTS
jgi:hypothetical protein